MAAKRSEVRMTNSVMPVEVLVNNAEQQRKRLHNDFAELRSSFRRATDTKKLARENLPAVCGVAGLVGLILGYGFAGMFVRD